MKNKITISISINEDILKWISERAVEWHVSRSWLIENMLYTAMIKSGVLPDENKSRD